MLNTGINHRITNYSQGINIRLLKKMSKRTLGYKMGEINVNIAYNNKIEIQI